MDDREAHLAERARREGMEFRVEQRPGGAWVAGFWVREGVSAELVPEGVMRKGAEAQTRERALADFIDLLKLEDAKS